MNVLLVNPRGPFPAPYPPVNRPRTDLLALAACIPEHDTRVVDTFTSSGVNVHGGINLAHVVVIKVSLANASNALEIARIARNDRCVTIACTSNPAQDHVALATDPCVDVVINGKDTLAFRKVIDYLDGNPRHELLESIEGITYTDETGMPAIGKCIEDHSFPAPASSRSRTPLVTGRAKTHVSQASRDPHENLVEPG